MPPRRFNFLALAPLFLCAAAAGADNPQAGDDPWTPSATARLSDDRSLKIERRVHDSNPRRVNHHYRFTVQQPGGTTETVEWPATTEIRHKPWKLKHAAWLDDGYVVLVLKEGHLAVCAWIIDMRPGEGRPDIARQRVETLTKISGLDGPAVKSVTVSGSVKDGSLTIRLFGWTPTHEGEVIRATLAKEGQTYRWKIERSPPPPRR